MAGVVKSMDSALKSMNLEKVEAFWLESCKRFIFQIFIGCLTNGKV